MAYLRAKIEHLVIENSENHDSFVRSFATKPTTAMADRSGKVFGVVEIGNTHNEIPHLIDLIIDEIKSNYYYAEEQSSLSPSERLESALKKTNLAIASFIESEHISLDLEKVNIAIGLSHNQELHFAVVGEVGIMLLYHSGRGQYKIINILESSKTARNVPDPIKFFTQVISGRMRPSDILFLTTANLLDYFSLDSIKNAIVGGGTIDQLRILIEQTKSRESFAALTVFLERSAEATIKKTETDLKTFNYAEAATHDSINELIRTEQETEKLLTPSLFPELKKYAGGIRDAFSSYLQKISADTSSVVRTNRSRRPVRRPTPSSRPSVRAVTPKIGTDFSKIGDRIQKSTHEAQERIQKFSDTLSKKPAVKKSVKKMEPMLRKVLGKSFSRFNTLPNSSKLLLVVVVVLVILFTNSIFWLRINNAKQEQIENFNTAIIDITAKHDEAQSSLIYRDEGQARLLMAEALGELRALEPTSDSQIKQKDMLLVEIEQNLQELRHITTLTDPVQVVNFQNLDAQTQTNNILLFVDNVVYTQNIANQAIYSANVQTRTMSTIFSPTANTGQFSIGTVISPTELLFFNDNGAAFRVNPVNENIENVTVNITDNAKLQDVSLFGSRLYLLDSANNQIYRYSPAGSGYGSATNWITAGNVDLANARGMVIDGSIYVLRETGQISRFERGAPADFNNDSIDPPLERANKLKSPEGSNFLYLLDPATKRLVVLDKEGKLIQQYTSDKFNDLKDFAIDEAGKQAFLLNGTAVFGVILSHL